MQRRRWLLAAVFLILAPGGAFAQFEGLRFTDLPAVGTWSEYQVTRRNESSRIVTSQRLSFLGRTTVADGEYYWFQLEMESDDFGPRRVPMISQIALSKADALTRKDYFRNVREMIVQVASAKPFRIAKDFIDVGVKRNMLTGGEKGAGSDVEYSYRELSPEKLKTKAGEFTCERKKGLGKAEIVLSLTNPVPERFPVDSISDLWISKDVPFGTVKQVTKQTGKGPQTESLTARIDTEETVELVAFGTGAKSAIHGPVVDYSPAASTQFRPPPAPSPGATP